MGRIFVKTLRKMTELRTLIEQAWDNRALLEEGKTQEAIREVINLIDLGELRCAEPTTDGWQINEWVKKAVVMYFPIQKMEVLEAGIFEYHDKIPLKKGYKEKGVRVVSPCSGQARSLYFQRHYFDAELRKYWCLCR